jgi:hypothetical protein
MGYRDTDGYLYNRGLASTTLIITGSACQRSTRIEIRATRYMPRTRDVVDVRRARPARIPRWGRGETDVAVVERRRKDTSLYGGGRAGVDARTERMADYKDSRRRVELVAELPARTERKGC